MRLAPGLLCALVLAGGVALAQDRRGVERGPALFSADEMSYDQELGLVTASGQVEVVQAERVLMADRVTYNEKDGTVTASGNVSILEPTGEVLFADYAELTDELKNGFVQGVRALLADNSRLAAIQATRQDGNRTVMDRAVFSPCNLCQENPRRAPLWQVRAGNVVHDQANKEIQYRNAAIEVFGIPVAWTPYLSHPDPTVKRQSGFLVPDFTRSEFFGFRSQTPYFFVLDDVSDATLTPQISTQEGMQFAGEYRRRFTVGEWISDGSLTYVDERDNRGRLTGGDEVRGHFRSRGRFRPQEPLLTGFDVFRASDATYTRRYGIREAGSNTLTSRVFADYVDDRNFLGANAFAFQNLRADRAQGEIPYVLPLINGEWLGPTTELGGRFGFDGSLLALYRTDGADTRRAAGSFYYRLPYTSPLGDVYTATASVNAAGYWVDDFVPLGAVTTDDRQYAGRLMPQLHLDWRWPFVRQTGSIQQVIEPIIALTTAPYGGNPKDIPNEDSLGFELDETNIFAASRFPGVDRFEGGHRAAYGGRFAAYGSRGGFTEVLVGHSYRLKPDSTFPAGSGLARNESDYVGRLTISPNRYLTLTDRVRIDADDGSLRRHEVSLGMGPESLRFTTAYALIKRGDLTRDLQLREAVSVGLTGRLTENYTFGIQHLHDLGPDGGALRSVAQIKYLDECLELLFYVGRSYSLDRDITPSTTFGVRINLLGFG